MTTQRRTGAEALVRELDEPSSIPCVVRHPDAGGQCERTASIEVYRLAFCEVHGAEVKAGALTEAYQDAVTWLSRLNNVHVSPPNPETTKALRQAVSGLQSAWAEAEISDDEALRRAYPFNRERVDPQTLSFDILNPSELAPPDMRFGRARQLVHRLMRQAFEEGAIWLVEHLELQRETVAAQYAWALVHTREQTARLRGLS
jgi:hypothetical protein